MAYIFVLIGALVGLIVDGITGMVVWGLGTFLISYIFGLLLVLFIAKEPKE